MDRWQKQRSGKPDGCDSPFHVNRPHLKAWIAGFWMGIFDTAKQKFLLYWKILIKMTITNYGVWPDIVIGIDFWEDQKYLVILSKLTKVYWVLLVSTFHIIWKQKSSGLYLRKLMEYRSPILHFVVYQIYKRVRCFEKCWDKI